MRGIATLAAAFMAMAALVPCTAQNIQDLMMDFPGAEAPQDPAEGRGEGAEESYVMLLMDSDTILLKDGTEVNGTVILIAEKKVIILTEEGEELIDRENIEEIVQRKDYSRDEPVTLPVREIDGFQFIVMEPIEGEPADAAGPVPEERPAEPRRERPRATPTEKRPRPDVEMPEDILKKLKPEEIRELLTKDDDLDDLLRKVKKAMKEKSKNAPRPTVKW